MGIYNHIRFSIFLKSRLVFPSVWIRLPCAQPYSDSAVLGRATISKTTMQSPLTQSETLYCDRHDKKLFCSMTKLARYESTDERRGSQIEWWSIHPSEISLANDRNPVLRIFGFHNNWRPKICNFYESVIEAMGTTRWTPGSRFSCRRDSFD